MLPDISKIKGVHPGAVLDREFKKRGIKKSVFAKEIGEYPGIITDITKQRRGINANLALRIERALGAEEGYFMLLQAYYEISEEKKKEARNSPKPDLSVIRKALFWDVNFEMIDFQKRKRFIIERIFERGNEEEILEIIRFYKRAECERVIKSASSILYSAVENAENYLNLKREDLACYQNSTQKLHRAPYL